MPETKLWTRNFLIITMINFLFFFSFQLFPSALPPYLKTLGASNELLGWLQGVLTFAALLIRPFAGVALDKYGRRGIFMIGLLGMMISSAAYLFFPVVGVILAIRFAHGLSWGVASTACSTIASDSIEKKRFAEGMGFFSLAGSIALALAPAVSLSISLKHDVYLAVLLLVAAFGLLFLMRFPKTEAVPETEKKKLAPYAKEAVLPSFLALLITMSWGAVVTFLALYGAQKSVSNVGLYFTAFAVSSLLTRPFVGRLVDRKGFSVGIWLGVFLSPAGLLILATSSGLPGFLLSASLYGIGNSSAQASLQAMAIIRSPKSRTGAANATFFTGFDLGIGLGSVLAGIVSAAMGYSNMFAMMAIFPVLAAILYFVSVKHEKQKSVMVE